MAMKVYSAFPKTQALLEPHHQIVWCHNQDTRWASLTLYRDTVGVFYSRPPSADWTDLIISKFISTRDVLAEKKILFKNLSLPFIFIISFIFFASFIFLLAQKEYKIWYDCVGNMILW